MRNSAHLILTPFNFMRMTKGTQVLFRGNPGTVLAVNRKKKEVSFLPDPVLQLREPTREEIMADILSKRTSKGQERKQEYLEIPQKKVVITERMLKTGLSSATLRHSEAVQSFKSELKGVREGYDAIYDPRVMASVAAKEKKVLQNMKRRYLRRRAKLANA